MVKVLPRARTGHPKPLPPHLVFEVVAAVNREHNHGLAVADILLRHFPHHGDEVLVALHLSGVEDSGPGGWIGEGRAGGDRRQEKTVTTRTLGVLASMSEN
jgi:hypothetical protein